MLQAQEVIKDKFWIVMSSVYGKVGTLRKVNSGYEFYDQRNDEKSIVDNMDEAFKIKQKATDESGEETITVDGYDSGVTRVYPVDEENELPVFRKTEKGKTIFAAGYYIVKFEGMGWQHAFAPKLSTLTKYFYRGPFFSKWEMYQELRKHRRSKDHAKDLKTTNNSVS